MSMSKYKLEKLLLDRRWSIDRLEVYLFEIENDLKKAETEDYIRLLEREKKDVQDKIHAINLDRDAAICEAYQITPERLNSLQELADKLPRSDENMNLLDVLVASYG